MTRRIIHCTSIQQMIDYTQAFADGGMAGLQAAIKKGNDMQEQKQYDNSNSIAMWPREDNAKGVYTGGGKNSDWNGRPVANAVLIQRERVNGKSPIADLFWSMGDSEAYTCPIWRNDDDKLGGKIDGWWVNLFANDKGPKYRVKFKAMEAAADKEVMEAVGSMGDEIPL